MVQVATAATSAVNFSGKLFYPNVIFNFLNIYILIK